MRSEKGYMIKYRELTRCSFPDYERLTARSSESAKERAGLVKDGLEMGAGLHVHRIPNLPLPTTVLQAEVYAILARMR